MMKRLIKRVSAILLVFMLMAAYLPFMTYTAEAEGYYSFSKPSSGSSYAAGSKIPVKFWAGVENTYTKFDAWGRPESTTYNEMPATLKVFKGSTEIYSKEFTYTKARYIETSYTPSAAGTIKLCIYGRNRDLSDPTQHLQAQMTVKVKKAKASAVKKFKPAISVERTAKSKAVINCAANYGYSMKIYRSTSKNGRYKLIKTTSKSSFTDSKLSSSKVYYYKARVCAKSGGKTYLSKWSSAVSAPKYLSGLSLSNTSKGVKVKWKKVKGTGYYLIRKSTKGIPGENEDALCYGGDETECIDKDVVKGKTYYYSVTAYKDDGTVIKRFAGKNYKITVR